MAILLVCLFSYITRTGVFLESLKISRMKQNKNKHNLVFYRPVNSMSMVAKLIEHPLKEH